MEQLHVIRVTIKNNSNKIDSDDDEDEDDAGG